MSSVRVTCVTKPNRFSTHEHITHLGGNGWTWTREEVIRSIDAHSHTFYVQDEGGHRADVRVVDPGNGRTRYVRTYTDGVWTDNLLALPPCS